jgi:hypothetical protein
MASVARECSVHAKVAESHFALLEDLLIAVRLPVFARRAKRRMIAHPKFYFFDAGVYRALRPKGPLDTEDEVDGAALETLFLANLRAVHDAFELGYELHYWRTGNDLEVDFVLYGERGLLAIEVKRSARVRDEDLAGLLAFREDYPMARAFYVHPGGQRAHHRGVEIVPWSGIEGPGRDPRGDAAETGRRLPAAGRVADLILGSWRRPGGPGLEAPPVFGSEAGIAGDRMDSFLALLAVCALAHPAMAGSGEESAPRRDTTATCGRSWPTAASRATGRTRRSARRS